MSAWAEIVYADSSDEWLAMCSRALAEVQAEQRRKDAAKIRAFDGPSITMAGNRVVPLDMIAALIDSEVSDD